MLKCYTSELRDHWDDLRSDLEAGGMEAEAAERRAGERLGSVDMLTASAVAAYRRRTFAGQARVVSLALFRC